MKKISYIMFFTFFCTTSLWAIFEVVSDDEAIANYSTEILMSNIPSVQDEAMLTKIGAFDVFNTSDNTYCRIFKIDVSEVLTLKVKKGSLYIIKPNGAGNNYETGAEIEYPNSRDINNLGEAAFGVTYFMLYSPENEEYEISFVKKNGNTSALSQTSNSCFTISTEHRNIIVSNTSETVQVYSISGQCVAQGAGAGSYSVPTAGVYIVKVGESIKKVIVNN